MADQMTMSPLAVGSGAPFDPTMSSLAGQVAGETEELRKKRLAAMQASKGLPTDGMSSLAVGYGAALSTS
jgi:hypothetical protein